MALIDKYPKLAEILADPKKKMIMGLILLAIALFIGLVIYNSVSGKDKKVVEVKMSRTAAPDIAEGESGDDLGNSSMLAAHERATATRRTSGMTGENIWEASAPDISDDLDLNTEKVKDEKDTKGGNGRINTTDDAMRFFGIQPDPEAPATTTPGTTRAPSSTTTSATAPTSSSTTAPTRRTSGSTARTVIPEQRMQEVDDYMISMGYDPRTGLPIEKKAEPEPEKPQAEPEPEKRVVSGKRTGGISSLGDSFGGSLDNLDNQQEYVTEDVTHPYRVMFIRDQKISNGDRVTLRLLEDLPFNGILIPANTHLQATVKISDRLELNVTSFEMNGKLYSTNYTAYDNDGGKGLYCPDTSASKNAKDGGNQAGEIVGSALQGGITGMAGRIITAGSQIVRTSTGKVSVSLTSGYQFFLMREKK